MSKENDYTITIVLFVVLVPFLAYFGYYSYKRNKEFDQKFDECQQQCVEDGFLGSEFSWGALGKPVCECVNK